MIYSGSSFEFSFPNPGSSGSMRIRIQPVLIEIFIIIKNTLKSIKKKESNIYFAILHFIRQSYRTNNPELTVLFICCFTFCWIRNYNSRSRSGSGTIIQDPDPGTSSGSMRIRIRNTSKYRQLHIPVGRLASL